MTLKTSPTAWSSSRVGIWSRQMSVVGLNLWRGPSYVARFVIAVIVYSVKRMTGGTRSDVFKECDEVFNPFLAHADSASAVAMVLYVVDVFAAVFRVHPCAIFRRVTSVVSDVTATYHRHLLAQSTATGECGLSKVVGDDINNRSALTLAPPRRATSNVLASIHNGETIELLAGKV